MKLQNGLHLTSIKCKRNFNVIENEDIKLKLSLKRSFQPFSMIKKKSHKNFSFSLKKLKAIKEYIDNDNNKTDNIFDTLFTFDQSKQSFFDEEGNILSNEKILKLLEEELNSNEKNHIVSTAISNLNIFLFNNDNNNFDNDEGNCKNQKEKNESNNINSSKY